MVSTNLPEQIAEVVEDLDATSRQQVLDFARALQSRQPKGVPGRDLVKFAGTMTTEEADDLQAVIDEGCGQVDPHGW